MGGAESVIRNVDKRTARREHRAVFCQAIDEYRANLVDAPEDHAAPDADPRSSANGMQVFVRKRPIFQREIHDGEFDVISCKCSAVIIHDARMESDMRRMFMNHHRFKFSAVFGEHVDNDNVYHASAAPLVKSAALLGTATVSVTMSFVELAGDTCRDMLNEGRPAQLITGANGEVQPFPVTEVKVASAGELATYISFATALRATEVTGSNHAGSSRTHAVLRVYVSWEGEEGEEGVLTLVDLAGSEHRTDSKDHNAQRRKEGAQINSSLMAMKECVRARAASAAFVPYRKSKLTHLLKTCFTSKQ
eukprot:gene21855-26308_t